MRKLGTMMAAAIAFGTVVALPSCGDGDDKSKAGRGETETSKEASGGNTLRASDVGFTFEFPSGFRQEDHPAAAKDLAIVAPDPGDLQNGLKVGQTSAQELPFASYAHTIRAQFAAELGTEVKQGTETHGGLEMGTLAWRAKGLRSTSYFFTGGGKTWQLECLSTTEHASEIDAACAQALDSIEFNK